MTRVQAILYGFIVATAVAVIAVPALVSGAAEKGITFKYIMRESPCLVRDPPNGSILPREKVEANDTFQETVFVTNTCRNPINTKISINRPNKDFATVDSDDEGDFDLRSGQQIRVDVDVAISNSIPDGVKDLKVIVLAEAIVE